MENFAQNYVKFYIFGTLLFKKGVNPKSLVAALLREHYMTYLFRRGGASIYGKTFEDEIHPELKHTGAGVLSMANRWAGGRFQDFFLTLINVV